MSEQIRIKGKLVDFDGHPIDIKTLEGIIELTPKELAGQLTPDNMLTLNQYVYNRRLLDKILPQPQQFPISACCNASVEIVDHNATGKPIYVCRKCQRVCNLVDWNKPQQEFCECYDKDMLPQVFADGQCTKCGKEFLPIPPHPEAKKEIEELILLSELGSNEQKIIDKLNELIRDRHPNRKD